MNEVTLTRRQMQVLRGLAEGATYVALGRTLHISPTTAKNYVKELYQRLGARNAANAVHIAHTRGLLGGDRG